MQLIRGIATVLLLCGALLADATGTWTGGGYSLSITELAGAITGTVTDPAGVTLPLSNGQIAGARLSFETRTGPLDGLFYSGFLTDSTTIGLTVRTQRASQKGPAVVLKKQ